MRIPCSVMQLGGWALVKPSGKTLGWGGPRSRHLVVQCRKDPPAPADWLSPVRTTVGGIYLCFRPRAIAGTMQQSQVHPVSRLSGHDILKSPGVFQGWIPSREMRAVQAGSGSQPRARLQGFPLSPERRMECNTGSSLSAACHWACRVGWKLASE